MGAMHSKISIRSEHIDIAYYKGVDERKELCKGKNRVVINKRKFIYLYCSRTSIYLEQL